MRAVGLPSQVINHSDREPEQEKLYQELTFAKQNDYLVFTSSLSGQQREIASESGLISGQSFELLSIHEVEDQDGEIVRLLKLRNPWGIEAWSGDWSNISDRWTEELRGQLGYIQGSAEQKAVFFIRFEDYIEQFKRTCIAAHFVREPQAHSRVKHSFKYEKSIGTTKPAFFRFFLDRELDLAQETLSISVH